MMSSDYFQCLFLTFPALGLSGHIIDSSDSSVNVMGGGNCLPQKSFGGFFTGLIFFSFDFLNLFEIAEASCDFVS